MLGLRAAARPGHPVQLRAVVVSAEAERASWEAIRETFGLPELGPTLREVAEVLEFGTVTGTPARTVECWCSRWVGHKPTPHVHTPAIGCPARPRPPRACWCANEVGRDVHPWDPFWCPPQRVAWSVRLEQQVDGLDRPWLWTVRDPSGEVWERWHRGGVSFALQAIDRRAVR